MQRSRLAMHFVARGPMVRRFRRSVAADSLALAAQFDVVGRPKGTRSRTLRVSNEDEPPHTHAASEKHAREHRLLPAAWIQSRAA